MSGSPPFVDEHRITVGAPRERVWAAARDYCERSLVKDRDSPLFRLLGTEPRTGFTIAAQAPGKWLELEGRHRFAQYRLHFELDDLGGGSTGLAALTYADFPGLSGRVYRLLVVGSGGHRVAVRGMLRSISRSSRVD
ncbi:hypothetical protein [Glycomyces harbinensis]|uniref:Polyketide cyclase / dehydrase and lipid transport n=1 Tax=Glycomyces harbinensis TaxID=58114 RepID=A0A1G7BZ49_9ACTN|nr:hypothetical protein [Glycomyces harbinensis]SDE32322.1 hypothetical protein SAMN05216270_11858 [Glycomyces harbinensis]